MAKNMTKNIELNPNSPEFRRWVHRIASGAMKDTIAAHGPITVELVNSAAKRVAGRLCGELRANNG